MFLSCQCYLHVRRDHGDARRTRVRSHTKFKLSVYKCWERLTLPRPTWALARSSDIAMLSRGPARPPRYNSIPSRVSPHPHEVACVLNTITEILAASAEIIRRERGNSCLPIATLDRVSAFSESLWEEVMSLRLSTIPPLNKPLIIYGLILVDIQHILSSSDPRGISDDTIDHRLDDFLLQFQETLDFIKGPTGQGSSPQSTHFFQNSHHFIISGGNFTASTSNPVVHDPVVREQSHQIFQLMKIQCVVLFS